MNTFTVPALVIRREYAASPEEVYDVWTNPELAQFLCPQGMTVASAELDVRVGGAYRIDMRTPENEAFVAYGTYREVQAARRLSMTWTWEENSPEEEHETLLTLEFNPHGSGTELILTHERLSSEESRRNHSHGWNSMLDKLHRLSGTIVETSEISAPPDRVFRALASEEVTRWWVRPGVFDTREWTGEVRTGGRWAASGVGGGNPYTLEGEFLEVRAPEKLVHTWHLAGTPGAPTTVTYELEPTQSGTRVTLKHEGFTSPEGCANTAAGWETSLQKLEDLFPKPT